MLAGEGQASPGEFERVLKSVRDDTCFSQKRQQDRLVRVMSRGLERVKIALNWLRAITTGYPLTPNRSRIGACSSSASTVTTNSLARGRFPAQRQAAPR